MNKLARTVVCTNDIVPDAAQERYELDLAFAGSSSGRTELVQRSVCYPWSVTQPFYDDFQRPNLATIIPQSSSGGLFANEHVSQRVALRDRAEVMLVAQGATLVHRQTGERRTRSDWCLSADSGSRLEVLNDPVVLSANAGLSQSSVIRFGDGARVLFLYCWTWVVEAGRPAFARYANQIDIFDFDGHRLALERCDISSGEIERLRAATARPIAALGVAVVAGDVDAVTANEALTDTLREIDSGWTGVSTLPRNAGVVVRTAFSSAAEIRQWGEQIWRTMRLVDFGVQPERLRRSI
ncbi:MAG: urease accessory protein UreD [Pseudomonadota bacterium]